MFKIKLYITWSTNLTRPLLENNKFYTYKLQYILNDLSDVIDPLKDHY